MNRRTGLATVLPSPDRAGRYERLTDAGPDLVSLHAPDGRFLEASPAAFSLLGKAPEDLRDWRWQDFADPSERERVAAWWRSLGDPGPAQLTFRAVGGDGQVVWLECVATVALTESKVTHVQATTRDVTRHRWHADELSRRCSELESQASRLEQANRDLLVLAADAAHDLRAPVQVITGFAQLLAAREGARLDEVSQEFLAHILAAAGGMRDLVDAVLEHSRASFGPLDLVSIECHTLVSDVLARLDAEIGERKAEVDIHALPAVWGDRVQLGRVFQNLISNAISAVPPARRPKVTVSAHRLPWQWQLSVADNGVGVRLEDRTRIFEPFQRGEAGSGRGSGLGLAICKAIVERHGGRIWVEEAEDGGSRFVFTLTAAPDRAPGLARMGMHRPS
jgi:PAS domain S-box-containing protein